MRKSSLLKGRLAQTGATLPESALLVALTAVMVIGVVQGLGGSVSHTLREVSIACGVASGGGTTGSVGQTDSSIPSTSANAPDAPPQTPLQD
jgi:Flp pilus assembly pilin Flp